MTPDDSKFLAELKALVSQAKSTIQPESLWNDFDRLLTMVESREREIERLAEHKRLLFEENGRLLAEKESGQWDANCAEIVRLRKMVDVAREAIEHYQSAHYDHKGEACCNDTVADEALAELDRLEKGGEVV
jgi:hypothetical protein